MTNFYNKKLAEQGHTRRAMLYHLHITKKLTATNLARRYGISPQRMSAILRRAKKEV